MRGNQETSDGFFLRLRIASGGSRCRCHSHTQRRRSEFAQMKAAGTLWRASDKEATGRCLGASVLQDGKVRVYPVGPGGGLTMTRSRSVRMECPAEANINCWPSTFHLRPSAPIKLRITWAAVVQDSLRLPDWSPCRDRSRSIFTIGGLLPTGPDLHQAERHARRTRPKRARV